MLESMRNTLRMFGMTMPTFKKKAHPNLVQNFRLFGPEMGAFTVEDYDNLARRFYEEGLKSSDPLYTVVLLPKHRCGIDYNGEYRGIYEPDGSPIAFFKPNFRALGYISKTQELDDWKAGRSTMQFV